MTDARARSSRAWASSMSISARKPHSGPSMASADCTSTRGSPVRTASGCGSAGGRPGSKRAVDEQSPHVLERDPADQLLDVDAPVAERAALLVGLGDLGREGDHALQPGLDFAHGTQPTHRDPRAAHSAGSAAERIVCAQRHGRPRLPPRSRGRRADPGRRRLGPRGGGGIRAPHRGARPAARRVRRARPRGRARRGRRDRARRSAGVRRRARRGQGEHGRGRAVHELRLALPRRPPADAQRVPGAAAARRPGSSWSGRPTCPSSGSCRRRSRATPARPATRGTPSARPAGPRAARRPRSPRGSSRSRTATTAAARSASPPRAAASSGSSPAAGGSPAGRTWATPSSPATAC